MESPNTGLQNQPPENELKKLEEIVVQRQPSFKRLNSDERRAVLRASMQAASGGLVQGFQMQVVHQGPLPDPETLARYQQIIPNGAERIMKMAEEQSAHRRQLEKTVIDSQQCQGKRGQLFGFIVALVCIIASAGLAMTGHETVASVLGGSTVIGLVAVFITGKWNQEKNLAAKRGE